METQIKISPSTLDVGACIDWVKTSATGGIDVFIGTVRDVTNGKSVTRLEFEAYDSMAQKEMQKIANEAHEQWQLQRVLVHHRTGVLQIGEIPVVIAVSSAHRVAAFEACRYIIDTLKQTVPIWKKEIFEDGEEWVAAHP